ncbi:hypothetical protein C8R44DRAFT_605982 [Mycena epipterygia]|nr:hypothetical protein C8R44DRAFT_605982 [Mycena epipterygia]
MIPLAEDDKAIIIMPVLRTFDDPPFQQLSEVAEAFHQFFQGLNFMHQRRIAHRTESSNAFL